MTRVLITGAGGQLGRELVRQTWSADTQVWPLTSADLDITNESAVEIAASGIRPDVIVNAAAFTDVDRAEDEECLATLVNGTAVGYLAQAADRTGALLIQISTDYVFDGSKTSWYLESDPVAPLGAYGRSKAAGERAAGVARKSVILRTAWVYGAFGSNFVVTMLRLAAERDELGVVDDQVGCPTSAADLAAAIRQLIEVTGGGQVSLPQRLYHVASPKAATWHEFATAVFGASSAGFDGICHRLSSAKYPMKAARPANSRLDSRLLCHDLGITLPPWQRSLPGVVGELEGCDV